MENITKPHEVSISQFSLLAINKSSPHIAYKALNDRTAHSSSANAAILPAHSPYHDIGNDSGNASAMGLAARSVAMSPLAQPLRALRLQTALQHSHVPSPLSSGSLLREVTNLTSSFQSPRVSSRVPSRSSTPLASRSMISMLHTPRHKSPKITSFFDKVKKHRAYNKRTHASEKIFDQVGTPVSKVCCLVQLSIYRRSCIL